MKKLLLLSVFFCSSLVAMDKKSFLEQHKETIKYGTAASALLSTGLTATITAGGCTLIGPVFLTGAAIAAYYAKQSCDKSLEKLAHKGTK